MTFDQRDYWRTVSHFATGITVVTTVLEDKCYGLTVSAFCPVSREPPLVLVSLDKTSRTHDIIRQSRVYGVNILSAGQQAISERFASKEAEAAKNFSDIPCKVEATGAPLFVESLANLDCEVVAEYEGGDHTLFLGKVVGLHYGQLESPNLEVNPVLYFRSRYHYFPSDKCRVS